MDATNQCLRAVQQVEYSVFVKDGIVDDKLIENLIGCAPESCRNLIDEIRKVLNLLQGGEYVDIFKTPYSSHLLGQNTDTITDYQVFLKEMITNELSLESDTELSYVRQLYILLLAISCLQLVVQQNWTGPPLNREHKSYLLNYLESNEKMEMLREQSVDYLEKDSEEVYSLADFKEFLFIAKIILVECGNCFPNLKTFAIWQLRCHSLHQQLIDGLSASLKTESFYAIEKVLNVDMSTYSKCALCRVHLECGYCFLQYFEQEKAKEQFKKVQEIQGLDIYLEGALGKKTKFQQIDYTQLYARAKLIDLNENNGSETAVGGDLPKDVLLDDDTLLGYTKFTNKDDVLKQEKLDAFHLATILAECFLKQKSQARHELLAEEILATVSLVISQPHVWSIQTVALLLRSRYERNSSRKKERSMLQVQSLVDQYGNTAINVNQRLKLFYNVLYPARWLLEKELADLFQELSINKSALEIYERLQLWEDVTNCYISLGRYEKAEEVVRKQLDVKETPKLWCLLGDVTKSEEYYHKAWQLSEHHSARAQRSLGFLYLRAKKFAESIPYFEKSLEINSLQENVWFSLGCAAMVSEKLELAAKAFHWCVTINSDNSEAWNNLSSIYVKTNQKERAFKTFQEAIKLNYGNWHMWENFIIVSVDVGAFEDVFRAYHRLMDLKDKYCDTEILTIIVRCVLNNTLDHKGQPASRLKPKLLKLMGRITAQTTSNSTVWKLYSDLYKDGKTDEERDKFLQFLVRAHSTQMQTVGWEKEREDIDKVIALTLELSQAYYDASEMPVNSSKAVQLLSSCKLNLKGVLAKINKHFENQLIDGMDASLRESLATIEQELEKIMNRIHAVKTCG